MQMLAMEGSGRWQEGLAEPTSNRITSGSRSPHKLPLERSARKNLI